VNPIAPFIEPDWPAPPGVLALCTTRVGGCSLPPYDSFNLAHHVGDEHANLERNRALLASRLPQGTTVQWLNQVHGVQVIKASGIGKPLYPEADAAWSDEPGVACAVMTADCLPVLFCSLDGKHVAAAHAGWRGLLAGVLEAAVTALDTEPDQLMSWLGPAIGPGGQPLSARRHRDVFQSFRESSRAPLCRSLCPCPTALTVGGCQSDFRQCLLHL
jgi:YfiH family protein